MKKIKFIISLGFLFLLFGCNSWLEKEPLTQFTDDQYWTSEGNVKIFCNGFYSLFNGYGTGSTSTIFSNAGSGAESDYYFTTFSDDQANNNIDIFSTSVPATSTTWSTPYNYIRLANLLLARVDRVPTGATVINHYKGVAYFFRAFEYFELVKRYGDVPLANKYLDQDIDQSIIWGGRVSRNIVMDSVLNDLNKAVSGLYDKSKADVNAVNKDIANALKSRICLYEGTYSKYVLKDNARATKYLTEAKTAAEAVMATGNYSLNADYKTIYNSLDLTGNKEVLLYRLYQDGIVTHSVVGYCNSSTIISGLTKDAVESFLCTDGQPISISPLYKGDTPDAKLSIGQSTLKNRDKRLIAMVDSIICYTKKPNGSGFTSTTGYKIAKFDNSTLTKTQILAPNNPTDAPVFAYSEVLLNEAEACAELGVLTQDIVNNTINKLRTRAGITAMDILNLPNDSKRDADVPALIWEIRRERRVELMMNGMRYWDLRRWGKVSYLDSSVKPDIFKGAKAPAGTSGSPGGQDANGYILPYSSSSAAKRVVALPKNNLDPIPSGQLNLYKNQGVDFPQNTGW
jgi:hypothetical protein